MKIIAAELIKNLQNDAYAEDSSALQKLVITELNDNQFYTILQLLQEKKLSDTIESLNVSLNDLTVLPEITKKYPALKMLAVSCNQLTKLPDSIGYCTSLKALYASYNELMALPRSIGNCTELEEIFLSGNQLRELPDSMGNCTKLERLNVSSNQLTKLPPSIGNCTELKVLLVSKNHLTERPEETTISALQERWQRLEDTERRQLLPPLVIFSSPTEVEPLRLSTPTTSVPVPAPETPDKRRSLFFCNVI